MKTNSTFLTDDAFFWRLSEQDCNETRFVPADQTADSVCQHVELLRRHEKPVGAIPTGYGKLDNKIVGLKKADLIVVAAKPSHGKTSFIFSIADNLVRKRKTVAIFSLDMAREKIMERLISRRTSIPLWQILTGKLDKDEIKRIKQSADGFKKDCLYIDDEPSLDVLELRSRVIRLTKEHQLDVLIIDSFQSIKPLDDQPRNLNRTARALKMIAQELNIPVVVTVNLERKLPGHIFPNLRDLSACGSLDRYADVVLVLHRNDRLEDGVRGEDENLFEVFVEKNNNGPVGTIELKFNPECASIEEK